MKKLVSLILALALILALSTTAFATTLTIENANGHEYEGYQLLKLTTSLKTSTHPAGCDGTNHIEGCYNYAYTVNETYRAVLQTEVFTNGNWTDKTKPATSAGVTDDQILDYLGTKSSDGTNGTYGTLRPVADNIYRAIKAAGIAADATNLDGTDDTIAQGYWLIADVTDLTDDTDANSLVMVDTKGQDNLTIKPKTGLPTVEKKVKDINDSNSQDTTNNVWQDSADHDITDDVSFKLTATLPANLAGYNSYMISFHDTLSDGLTLKPATIKVHMINGETRTDVTDNFTRPNTAASTFEVACNNILAIDNVTSSTLFEVTYDATLNENAKIGSAGNPNEVYLEFSNNPYGTGTGKTEPDKVTVFTYKVVINKVDKDGNALKGAGFTLSKKNVDGTYTAIGTELKGENMTTFTWTGLDDGDYKLEESTVPAGYNKMADIEFTITAEHSEEAADPALTSLDGGNLATGVVDTGIIEKDIENLSGTVLPETGAQGTFFLITGGTLLAMVAVVFMITRKKMSIYED